jgi:catechol 2,3-dioxygenase-like lactoylglutathione lyase family enzyme
VPVELNDTIVHARDRWISAEFLADILGLEVGPAFGRFLPVTTGNGVTLDFASTDEEVIASQHYAFLVSDAEFDAGFEKIERGGITYYADPGRSRPSEINNHNDGGRGVYFLDPVGHTMELLTRPYGNGRAGA